MVGLGRCLARAVAASHKPGGWVRAGSVLGYVGCIESSAVVWLGLVLRRGSWVRRDVVGVGCGGAGDGGRMW